MPLNPGSIIGGKYRLGRRFATGGQGSIWVAEHIQLGSQVAIKFLDASLLSDRSALTRFEREARAAARIRHRNLVHVEDCGFEDGIPYLVMELFEGEDLLKRIRTSGAIPLDEVVRITHQIARGLRRLHEAGYVHRDLKPGNIFLARADDGEEVVKILDFGIVKQSGVDKIGEGTKTGEFVGSPHYMSPEQIQNIKAVDARSDLWSLAAVIFRALTNEYPFPGEAIAVIVSNILTGARRRPSELVPTLSPRIDEFFDRAFSRDPSGRFQSAIEMAEAFARAAGARVPMPSIMDGAWESPQNLEPSAPPPPAAELPERTELHEGTTLPRTPTGAPQARPAPHGSSGAPPVSFATPGPPARRSSDSMYSGAPTSSPPPPSPSAAPPPAPSPLIGLKGTQPLTRPAVDGDRGKGQTMRIPIAQREKFARSPAPSHAVAPPALPPPPPPPPPPPWERTPSQPGGAPASDPRQAGTGAYLRLEMAGSSEPTPRRSARPLDSEGNRPLWRRWLGRPPSQVRWVAGGLLVGTGVGAFIALIVFLIRG